MVLFFFFKIFFFHITAITIRRLLTWCMKKKKKKEVRVEDGKKNVGGNVSYWSQNFSHDIYIYMYILISEAPFIV